MNGQPVKVLGAAVAVVAAGAYLKWSTGPVIAGYRVGRQAERLLMDPARFGHVFRIAYDIGRRDRVTVRQGGQL